MLSVLCFVDLRSAEIAPVRAPQKRVQNFQHGIPTQILSHHDLLCINRLP